MSEALGGEGGSAIMLVMIVPSRGEE